MTLALSPAMAEALRLTRAGNVSDATSLIRLILAGHAPTDPPPPPDSGTFIDITPDRVTVVPKRAPSTPDEEARGPARQSADVGRFLERSFTGPAGTLAYRLYIPARATPGMPLVVMLHGCTQSAEDFARGTGMNRLADELGFLVAYPSQSPSANPQKCWNWFKPGDQQRDRGEPTLIAGITRRVIADEQGDTDRIYVAGLSAGGAAAAILGGAYPDLYAAIGIHSGLACGAARDLPGALMAMRKGGGTARSARPMNGFVPVITFHGDRDTTVHEINSRQIIAEALAASASPLQSRIEIGQSDGGRRYTREICTNDSGVVLIEQWTIHGAGHTWSGGETSGSYTDPAGPDASRAMLRFFLNIKLKSVGGMQ